METTTLTKYREINKYYSIANEKQFKTNESFCAKIEKHLKKEGLNINSAYKIVKKELEKQAKHELKLAEKKSNSKSDLHQFFEKRIYIVRRFCKIGNIKT